MPAILTERRFDFRGGLNVRQDPDLLQPNEMVDTTNTRLEQEQGTALPRLGTRRLHASALAASIDGIFQWNNAGTLQLVAVANGDIHHKSTDFGAFTLVSPTPALGTIPTSWATNRQEVAGALLRLYLADGVNVWRFDGAALTRLSTGANKPPVNSTLIAPYHIRNFHVSSDKKNNVVWSVLGDPEDITVGTKTQGGEAMVGIYRGEDIVALEVVGSSLLLATANSVARFTGYSAADIQIEQDTDGVDADVGAVGPLALARVAKFAAMLDTIGPHVVNEAEAVYIGEKIQPRFKSLDRANIAASVVGYHPGRREIWWAVPATGDGGLNKTVYVYDIDLGIWYGPFTYTFGITCFTQWDDALGNQFLVAGCSDGFARHMDIGTLDDVLSDGTGGTVFNMCMELAPFYFDPGPGTIKHIFEVQVHAEIDIGVQLLFKYAFDQDPLTNVTIAGTGGSGVKGYILPLAAGASLQGDRLRVQLNVQQASTLSKIHGITIKAFDMQRVAQ